jgi:hypothetical protein
MKASITTLVPYEQLPRRIGFEPLADGSSLVLATAALVSLLFAPLSLGGIFMLDLEPLWWLAVVC